LHELSVVFEVIKAVDKIVEENQLTEVEKIVLQIGELSSMIPKYVEDCFPAAVDRTRFEKTKLEIEITTANALCKICGKVFKVVENQGKCPYCMNESWELLSGKEFVIKEIIAR
jgi:hydrogenase nickel incorporation protein HypA/HybF